jgi:hypothetical protein
MAVDGLVAGAKGKKKVWKFCKKRYWIVSLMICFPLWSDKVMIVLCTVLRVKDVVLFWCCFLGLVIQEILTPTQLDTEYNVSVITANGAGLLDINVIIMTVCTTGISVCQWWDGYLRKLEHAFVGYSCRASLSLPDTNTCEFYSTSKLLVYLSTVKWLIAHSVDFETPSGPTMNTYVTQWQTVPENHIVVCLEKLISLTFTPYGDTNLSKQPSNSIMLKTELASSTGYTFSDRIAACCDWWSVVSRDFVYSYIMFITVF